MVVVAADADAAAAAVQPTRWHAEAWHREDARSHGCGHGPSHGYGHGQSHGYGHGRAVDRLVLVYWVRCSLNYTLCSVASRTATVAAVAEIAFAAACRADGDCCVDGGGEGEEQEQEQETPRWDAAAVGSRVGDIGHVCLLHAAARVSAPCVMCMRHRLLGFARMLQTLW